MPADATPPTTVVNPDAPFAMTLVLGGLSCAGCVGRAHRALVAVPGVDSAEVNLATETAQVMFHTPDALRGAIAALETAGYPARQQTAVLSVDAMSCASCVARVDRALAAIPGVLNASVNLALEEARVTYVEGATDPAALIRALATAGYPAQARSGAMDQGADPADDPSARKQIEADAQRRRALTAALIAAPVIILEMGGHLVPAFHHWSAATIGQQTSWLIQWVLTTIVLAGPGRQFYAKGFPALMRRAPDMNSLVAVGTAAAYGYSLVATFAPAALPETARAVYFEAAAVIVVLILTGRWLEARAKGRTGAAIQRLVGLQPKTARVLRNGTAQDVPLGSIVVGDLVQVRPGERIAVDGLVTQGSGLVDESMISGEPLPVAKAEGAGVTGGTVNGTSSLTVRATRVGGDTTLAQIIRMVEQAQGARLPIQTLVDRITLWFVPAVLALAALTVAVWLAVGPAPALSHALVAGVSVLIIACPCAMGLATPTSIMVGTGRAADMGVLFRKGDALQALHGVDVVAFDKTGTLTMGRPVLTDLHTAPGFDRAEVLAAVAALEALSEHPVAQAIVQAARDDGITPGAVTDFNADPGFGVSGQVGTRAVLVGADRMMTRAGIDAGPLAQRGAELGRAGKTPLYAAIDGQIAAVLAVSDPIKPGTAGAVAALHALGLKVAMITGDNAGTAQAVAQQVGIDHVVAEVLPDGKVRALDDLRSGGQRVAFVGDGINDAPALAAADVGIALGTGTDVAVEAADVVLMSGDLNGVVAAFDISGRTLRNIRQNLAWAFGYNVALLPVAAGVLYPAFGVLLSPMLAAGAMALSSVFVLTNALRLRRAPTPRGSGTPGGTRGHKPTAPKLQEASA